MKTYKIFFGTLLILISQAGWAFNTDIKLKNGNLVKYDISGNLVRFTYEDRAQGNEINIKHFLDKNEYRVLLKDSVNDSNRFLYVAWRWKGKVRKVGQASIHMSNYTRYIEANKILPLIMATEEIFKPYIRDLNKSTGGLKKTADRFTTTQKNFLKALDFNKDSYIGVYNTEFNIVQDFAKKVELDIDNIAVLMAFLFRRDDNFFDQTSLGFSSFIGKLLQIQGAWKYLHQSIFDKNVAKAKLVPEILKFDVGKLK